MTPFLRVHWCSMSDLCSTWSCENWKVRFQTNQIPILKVSWPQILSHRFGHVPVISQEVTIFWNETNNNHENNIYIYITCISGLNCSIILPLVVLAALLAPCIYFWINTNAQITMLTRSPFEYPQESHMRGATHLLVFSRNEYGECAKSAVQRHW